MGKSKEIFAEIRQRQEQQENNNQNNQIKTKKDGNIRATIARR
jgi:hypothetical protein